MGRGPGGARARFHDYDGVTREVEASGATGAAAERSLRVKLRDRRTPNDDEITGDTRIRRLAEVWLDEITAEQRIVRQTIDRYAACLHQAILRALGELRFIRRGDGH